VVRLRLQDGRTATLVADGRLFTNRALRETAAGPFVLGLVAPRYRRVVVDYGEFVDDPEAVDSELEFPVLKDLVRQRIEANESDLDLSIMDRMAGTEIVTAIAHAIPLSSAERQVLMETPSLRELEGVLLQLMAGPGGLPSFDLPMLPPS